MMKKQFLMASLVSSLGLMASGFAADAAPSVGVVNFSNCITESKLGKQEQNTFESLKKQMGALLEDTEKQLTEISTKFNDKEYLDSLSPEAEEEMKAKFRALNEELSRYQNQYYQVLNQANMKLVQVISSNINSAAEKVAKEKKLTMIINKEACFFYSPALEITSSVVAEMDKNYDVEMKKMAANAEAQKVDASKAEGQAK
jgi:outer membrane protein